LHRLWQPTPRHSCRPALRSDPLVVAPAPRRWAGRHLSRKSLPNYLTLPRPLHNCYCNVNDSTRLFRRGLPDGVQAHHTCLGAAAESESPLNERAPSQGRGAAQQNSENALWDFTTHPNPPTISNSSSQTIVQLRGSARMGTEPLYAVGFAAETERWQLRRKQHKRFGWTPGHIRIHTRRHRSRDRLARGNVLRNVWIWRNPNLPSQRPDY
jgi:hypothetical protein